MRQARTLQGYASFCTREDITVTSSAPPPAYQAQSTTIGSDDLVRALLDRVSQLEARLQEQYNIVSSETPLPPAQLADNPASPANDEAITLSTDNNITSQSVETGDAATVLEFLAWGRKKDADYGTSPEHNSGPRRLSVRHEDGATTSNILCEASRDAQLDVLESLLPDKTHIIQLVEYHNTSILWYHGSYSSAMFGSDLDLFMGEYEGNVRHEDLNLQWLGLLFAIMTGSITCAPSSIYRSWGFSSEERMVLSQRWYEATVTCLEVAGYIETHTIYSVQAIATLTIAAHILGKSNSQSILLASAGRIAQSLGLHRLGPENAAGATSKEQLRQREAGRRVFNQLCTQDWFQIPFSESYSLNPRFFKTSKPLNCNDEDMVPLPLSTPTQASYCNYRYDIAALMPQLLDAMTGCNTLFTKYEQVLRYDEKMRKLATACMPTFLSNNAPVATGWPIYVGWARRSLAICASHKIIMGPTLWIEQAFSVAAGIILSLDAFHRSAIEREFEEHKKLVEDAISYLRTFEDSKIASRGVQLLSGLQRELQDGGSVNSRKRQQPAEFGELAPSFSKRARTFNVESFINNVSRDLQVTTPTSSTADVPANVGDTSWNSFMNLLPLQTGFGGQSLFDDLLSFQF
ncbi:hypothetical protein AA0111_g4095 [Alternaria arborescens]|uniref:hypothetical protein n=1 Tax=Alternaria arborescens TaxID=156630 RepID=UPI001074D88F|nr:hypothetical protein AA0111_g4095 [Alternaria arborescens]RYO33437.1 hypothetical protein AA0111_g4095 [Alternaria arborescens]